MSDYLTRSISQIHQAYIEGKLSPLELVDLYYDQIQAQPLNAYITVCEDQARQRAHEQTEEIQKSGAEVFKRYPFYGIPIGVKDVFTTHGVRTTCGSKMLENYIPPYTATAVDRMQAAGAIVLGKLNMDEFAMGSSNENSAYGPVEHPTHPGYVPGGSSGGSAAAVAGKQCLTALATDTGGSIRLPASFCGVVGMKPTYGRVSRYGLVSYASSLDQAGAMAHTVEDTARTLNVMAGFDPRDSTSAPIEKGDWSQSLGREVDWSKLRVAIVNEYQNEGLDPAVQKSWELACQWFQKKGAQLVDVSLPHTKYAIASYYLIATSEASSNLSRFDGVRFGIRSGQEGQTADQMIDQPLHEYYEAVRNNFGDEVKRRIMLGTFALSSGYYDAYYKRACQVRQLIKRDFQSVFEQADFIFAPVAPNVAFKREEKTSDPLQMYLVDIFTVPANLAGLPALGLPFGCGQEGLPIGFQFMGNHFSEEQLIAIAHQFEKELGRGV